MSWYAFVKKQLGVLGDIYSGLESKDNNTGLVVKVSFFEQDPLQIIVWQ